MHKISIFSAGSFSYAIAILSKEFEKFDNSFSVNFECGPAGLMAEKVLTGATCDLFISADYKNAKKVAAAFSGTPIVPVCSSSLCVITLQKAGNHFTDALDVLADPHVRIGTSTPGDDPCGDYTELLFQKIQAETPALGISIRSRASALVGGRTTAPIPTGKKAALWLLETGKCDAFIGYKAFWNTYKGSPKVCTFDIPTKYNIQPQWFLTFRKDAEAAADFFLSQEGKRLISEAGFTVG